MLDWATILAAVNAGLALGIVIVNIRLFQVLKIARMIRIFIILIGIYWAGIYLYVVFTEPGIMDPVKFGQVFVRPAFTVTLAVMLASGIYRWRSK